MTPAEVALQMAELGMVLPILAVNISDKFSLRNELAIKNLSEQAKTQVKIEDSPENKTSQTTFPWHKIQSLKRFSKNDRKELRKILTKHSRTHHKEVRLLREKFEISGEEWKEWMKEKEQQEKQNKLKELVFSKAADRQITLQDFKKLSKRVYTSKTFRPTNAWCFNFINRCNLVHFF